MGASSGVIQSELQQSSHLIPTLNAQRKGSILGCCPHSQPAAMSRSQQMVYLLLGLLGIAAASFWNGASLFLGSGDPQQQPINPSRGGGHGSGGSVGSEGRISQEKKNIVFILTDDQDATMDSVSFMPRLREHIVDQGTHFANHFTTTAICCPSRVSLWTGRQPHNTNVTDVHPPYGIVPQINQLPSL